MVIISMSVYQAVTIPMQICFEQDFFNSVESKTLDSLIDLTFIIDIIFRFRTTFIDAISGEEIMDSYRISERYLTSSNFYIDVLSTIPFADLFESENFLVQLFGLLKLLRVQRISSVIMNLN